MYYLATALMSVPVFAAETDTYYNDPVDTQAPYTYKVIAKSGLNVRSQPSASATIIAVLPYGTIVDASFMQPGWIPDGWCLINSPVEGYVADEYLGNADIY